MRVMLGFDKGGEKNVNSSSKKPADYHKMLVEKVLRPHYPTVDMKTLASAVKNRLQTYVFLFVFLSSFP